MEYEDILYEKENGVAKITINRPEKRNALLYRTIREIRMALLDARTDRTVGVVVITGAGDKAFCSGADVSEGEPPDMREEAFMMARAIMHLPKPVIAMVNGYAIGGGNWLAYLCDLTIASENAVFGQVGPRVGSALTHFMTAYLSCIIGEKKAREMWFLCHQYSAQEALNMGLVNKVVPLAGLQQETDKWCQELLAMSPTALKTAKANFAIALQYLHHVDVLEELVGTDYLASEESQEGMKAFLEKRKPDFSKFRK